MRMTLNYSKSIIGNKGNFKYDVMRKCVLQNIFVYQ